MLPPLGLSLTSVTLRVERLFCLEVFSRLPRCMPATPEMIFLLFLLLRGSKFRSFLEPQHMERREGGGFLKALLFDVEN